MNKMRLLVVGCGSIIDSWLEAVKNLPFCEIAGLMALHKETVDRIGERYNVGQQKRYIDLAQALKQSEANVVLVLVPPSAHFQVVMQAFKAGLPVLSEKPLANNLAEAKDMVRESRRRNLAFMISQNYRYYPAIASIKQELEKGSIGKIGYINWEHHRFLSPTDYPLRFRLQMPHVMLEDMAIHHFDLMRYLTKADCMEVYAHSFNPQWSWYSGGAAANVLLKFEEDIYITYNSSWVSRARETTWDGVFTIEGEKGGIRLGNDGLPVSFLGNNRKKKNLPMPHPIPPRGSTEVQRSLVEFWTAQKEDREPSTSGSDNLKSYVIAWAAILSSREGRPIRIANLL